jgi:hypothetical protein
MKTYPLGKSISFYFTPDRKLRKGESVLDTQFELFCDVAWVYEFPDEGELEGDEYTIFSQEYFSSRVGVTV